jgi:hypothetical protein
MERRSTGVFVLIGTLIGLVIWAFSTGDDPIDRVAHEVGADTIGAGPGGLELARDDAGRAAVELDRVDSVPEGSVATTEPRELQNLKGDYMRYFLDVVLDARDLETWNEAEFLDWGVRFSPSPATTAKALDYRLRMMTATHLKRLERVDAATRAEAERIQAEFEAANDDLFEETCALAEAYVRRVRTPESVQVFEDEAAFVAADPPFEPSQWGCTFAWRHEGRLAFLLFDTASDPALRANVEMVDRLRAVRNADLMRVLYAGEELPQR